MTIPIRPRDISGRPFPPPNYGGGNQSTVLEVRPPWFEPPEGAKEFTLSFSTVAVGTGVLVPMFVLDSNNNVVLPSAALQLPNGVQARLNNVEIGGDTGTAPGLPQLIFSISTDRTGQAMLPGWEALGLPGRGGVVSVGFEPFTRVPVGSFFGGFVRNNSGAPLYAEMIITGWYW